MKHTPRDGVRGHWTGERGNSRFIPNENSEHGKEVSDTLEKYGLEGIEYKDGVPDFSECSEETVEISMTENRNKNTVLYGETGDYITFRIDITNTGTTPNYGNIISLFY